MKAAVLVANQDIRFDATWPDPEPGDDEVVLKVASAGICGSDLPRYFDNGARTYPLVLGHEFGGVVVGVGRGVRSVSIGDHAVGVPLLPCKACPDCQRGNHALCKHYSFIGSRRHGAFAEFVALPQGNVVPIAPSIPLDLASFFEVSTVALHALRHVAYQGGKTVAILGAGAVGLFAVQWARIFGAEKIVVIARAPDRSRLACRLGADVAVPCGVESETLENAMDTVGGRGFDYVFETAGAAETIRLSVGLAANKSRICLVGTPTKDLRFEPHLWERINRREAFLTGSWMSYSSPFPGEEWFLTNHFLANGALKLDADMVFRRYPLSEARDAFELYRQPGTVKGRVLLVP